MPRGGRGGQEGQGESCIVRSRWRWQGLHGVGCRCRPGPRRWGRGGLRQPRVVECRSGALTCLLRCSSRRQDTTEWRKRGTTRSLGTPGEWRDACFTSLFWTPFWPLCASGPHMRVILLTWRHRPIADGRLISGYGRTNTTHRREACLARHGLGVIGQAFRLGILARGWMHIWV